MSDFQPPHSEDARSPYPSTQNVSPVFQAELTGETDHGSSGYGSAARPPRGGLVMLAIAWLVILGITLSQMLMPYLYPDDEPTASAIVNVSMLELMGKYMLGAAEVGAFDEAQATEQINGMNAGPLEHRFCHAIMLNELDGAASASGQLNELRELVAEKSYVMNGEQEQMFATLETLFADYENELWESPSVSQPDRDQLVSRLGWFGQLAFAVENGPDQIARSRVTGRATATMWTMVVVTLFGLLVGCAGFAGFIVFALLLTTGRLQLRTENYCGNGRIYIESFAVWFVLFLALQIGVSLLLKYQTLPKGLMLPALLTATFASLASLLWPRLRGVPWSEVRRDLGLRCNNLFAEIGWGLLSYVCCLPILISGFIATAILMTMFGPANDASDLQTDPMSHPAIEWISSNGVWGYVFVSLMTVVSAPLVEETVFRGMMFRHLRDASHRWGRLLSVLFAGVINALIFAAIHPQGLLAIPVLASLAFSFTLVREWRGSLFAPMTMHALHNGMITCVWILVLI